MSPSLIWSVTFENYLFINPFNATGIFLYPLKTPENPGFLIFPGGIEKDQGHEMDQFVENKHYQTKSKKSTEKKVSYFFQMFPNSFLLHFLGNKKIETVYVDVHSQYLSEILHCWNIPLCRSIKILKLWGFPDYKISFSVKMNSQHWLLKPLKCSHMLLFLSKQLFKNKFFNCEP